MLPLTLVTPSEETVVCGPPSSAEPPLRVTFPPPPPESASSDVPAPVTVLPDRLTPPPELNDASPSSRS